MSPFLASGLVVGACVFLIWLVSLKLNDASIADIWWGPGFAVIAWVGSQLQGVYSHRLLVVQILLTAWGLRLGLHLGRRNWGQDEDRRYQAMRDKSDHFWLLSLFKVFLFQGAIQLAVSAPVFGMLGSTKTLGPLDFLGLAIALAGIVIEGVADHQLTHFLRNPKNKGKVMDQGLWAWSRHPNYFGNSLIWLGIGLAGLSAGASFWTLLGPALMLFLLLKVSGVSMLESTITGRRPDYQEYCERVPAFFPLPPRG